MTLYMTGKKRVETGMKIFSICNSFIKWFLSVLHETSAYLKIVPSFYFLFCLHVDLWRD